MTMIVGTFFVSVAAWLAYVAHVRWVNAHMFPMVTAYTLLMLGILYLGWKWIGMPDPPECPECLLTGEHHEDCSRGGE